ncbi:MAG TPA: hypothetical protein QGG18_07865, partial [Rhodospirillales bacterium]|nr:hypothetical protein [Rhodospirillales bacterium]
MADDPNQYRPNFKRQMTYAGIMLAAILCGYLLTALFIDNPETQPVKKTSVGSAQPVKPWYQKQSPPPAMITTLDLPLFPELEEGEAE